MKKTDKNRICAIVWCVTIVLEIFAFMIRPKRYESPDWAFYTVIANYVTLASAVFALIFIRNEKMKQAVSAFRFTAMIMLWVTFIIVVFVLVWFTDPLILLFDKNNFIHHIFAPMGTTISYYNIEEKLNNKKLCLMPLYISLVYSVIVVGCNLAGTVNGPYPFFMTQEFGLPTVLLYCCAIAVFMLIICYAGFRFKGFKKKHTEISG